MKIQSESHTAPVMTFCVASSDTRPAAWPWLNFRRTWAILQNCVLKEMIHTYFVGIRLDPENKTNMKS